MSRIIKKEDYRKCSICGKSFKRNSNLKNHVKRYYKPASEAKGCIKPVNEKRR